MQKIHGRRRAVFTAASIAGCALATTAGVGVATAATQGPIIPVPYISTVDDRPASGSFGGHDLYEVDEADFPVFVHAKAGTSIVVRDEDGTVLCEEDHQDLTSACDVHGLGGGDHLVSASVTDGGRTVTTEPVVIRSTVADDGDPGDGDPGDDTTPVVADPAPGAVDPDFTVVAPPAPATLERVEAGAWSRSTDIVLRGTPGDLVDVEGVSTARFDAQGLARVTDRDLLEGQERSYRVRTIQGDRETTTTVSVTGAGVEKTWRVADALTVRSVEQTAGGTEVTLAGTPGASYLLHQFSSRNRVEGTVPEDGIVRWTLPIAPGASSGFTWQTQIDGTEIRTGEFDIAGPEEPGDEGQPVVADPSAGAVDPDFSVGDGEPGDGGQPGDGGAPGDGGQPGDGEEPGDQVSTLDARVASTSPLFGGQAAFTLRDVDASQFGGYTVQVFVDGKYVGFAKVTQQGETTTFRKLGTGAHHVQFTDDHSTIVQELDVTI